MGLTLGRATRSRRRRVVSVMGRINAACGFACWCQTASGGIWRSLYLEQLARLGISWRRLPELACRDARERHDLPPTEGWPRDCEFVARRAVGFLRVKGSISATGIAEQPA